MSSVRSYACGAWDDLSNMVHLLIGLACRMLAANRAGDGKGAPMLTITTQRGKAIAIVLPTELRTPLEVGAHILPYCHPCVRRGSAGRYCCSEKLVFCSGESGHPGSG